MNIEITGTGTVNKGAELLLIATRKAMLERNPAVTLAVRRQFGAFHCRAKYGLRTVIAGKFPRREWLIRTLMNAKLADQLGVISESDVDVVLDASGFAFGDQLGEGRTLAFLNDVKRWRRQGKKIVLLPQAFGPFQNDTIRNAFKEVLQCVDLIYARDDVSLGYLNDISTRPQGKVWLAPDFTNLIKVEGAVCEVANRVLIIPNKQVVLKSCSSVAGRYLDTLAMMFHCVKESGLKPALLIHDGCADLDLVGPLCEKIGGNPNIIESDCPLELKRILQGARLVIGSRFHALVGALSQAVPVIAIGWSHKYAGILRDYGLPDNWLAVDATKDDVAKKLCECEQNRDVVVEKLKRKCEFQEELSKQMWNDVFQCIGL
jgi:polysaccharide pyruvyl transferase WcaK-like protein